MTLRYGLIASLLLMAACTRPVSLESAWQPGARPARPFSNVLVVAVSEDFNRRRVFENALVDELARSGTRATPSTRTMRTTDVLNQESMTALVKATGADAVLVTRLVQQNVAVKEKKGRAVAKMDSYDNDILLGDPYSYNIYNYDFTVSEEPSSLVIKRKARVITDLFEAGEGKVLYTIRSEVRMTSSDSLDQTTDVAVMDTLAADLAVRLRQDGAVR
jgi:hypothetical protein